MKCENQQPISYVVAVRVGVKLVGNRRRIFSMIPVFARWDGAIWFMLLPLRFCSNLCCPPHGLRPRFSRLRMVTM